MMPKEMREAAALAIARDQYCDDDTEIDSNATFSDAETEGMWVQAWVHVRDEDIAEYITDHFDEMLYQRSKRP